MVLCPVLLCSAAGGSVMHSAGRDSTTNTACMYVYVYIYIYIYYIYYYNNCVLYLVSSEGTCVKQT